MTISLGDIVKLNKPYREFEFGIVVEILDQETVSLHLYNEKGNIYLIPKNIPRYVDFKTGQITLYKIAEENGYKTKETAAYPEPIIKHLGTKTNPINKNIKHQFQVETKPGQKLFVNIGEQSVYTNTLRFEVIEKPIQEEN
ncbi:hypothetical protein [Synechococcus sp. PCC 6312]|uniref:hypothetical protein n=1 Tax=Synechococcus sp. (strain ATCC 27167 / PCC 6312) TaxID=195253 RepID=UPI00029EF3CA|nr:hypothetical protein [Synechococcus sp. PCC 6312]AFY61853.1 hypothetical protein Syn6312_2773 [Synechococcus sp. PCC 6312]